MRLTRHLAFFFVVFLSFHSLGMAQERKWRNLMDQAQMFYHEGRYAEGVRVAEEALSVAEQTFGYEHHVVAKSSLIVSGQLRENEDGTAIS